MFGVLAIIEILHYRGLPIIDPAHLATLLASIQTNMTFYGKFVSVQCTVHGPFSSDLRPLLIWAEKGTGGHPPPRVML